MRFLDTLDATFLTLKRTPALWLAIVAPLFIVCIRIFLFSVEGFSLQESWHNWIEGNYSYWTGVLLLITMALDVALLVELDRSAQIWKYLFALPVSRTYIYISKLIVATILMFMSGLILLVSTLLGGYLLSFLKPELGFSQSSPEVLYYLGAILAETLAAWFVIALYLWISLRMKNVILPLFISIVGAVTNLSGYRVVFFEEFSPWAYALDASRMLTKFHGFQPTPVPYLGWPLPILLTISVIGTLCIMLLGILEFNRRDIA